MHAKRGTTGILLAGLVLAALLLHFQNIVALIGTATTSEKQRKTSSFTSTAAASDSVAGVSDIRTADNASAPVQEESVSSIRRPRGKEYTERREPQVKAYHHGTRTSRNVSDTSEVRATRTLQRNKTTANSSEVTISEALQQKILTVVSGYFEMPGMPHHPASYFKRIIPGTLRFLKSKEANVVFYHNLNLSSHPLGAVFRNSGAELRKVELEDLPGARVSSRLRDLCVRGETIENTYRGNKCYYLQKRLRQFDSYYHVLSVWFSKLPFVDKVVHENPFKTEYFAWFDCGIMNRLGSEMTRYRLSPGKICTPHSSRLYGPKKRQVPHRMGLIVGPARRLTALTRLHKGKVKEILARNDSMCYDEEIVLAEVLRSNESRKEAKSLLSIFRK
eukprot:gb/GECG01003723.1/.p1 GENE.gb/GECG01003723.1/~~gb/GECG01003723.1/.p1  ORF type:complete len:390 (+),score=45.29 gb/GECG01003723.1/:1-1170(+)